MVKVESYKEKIYRLIKLKNQCIQLGYDVELEDDDFLPENIDNAISELNNVLESEGVELEETRQKTQTTTSQSD